MSENPSQPNYSLAGELDPELDPDVILVRQKELEDAVGQDNLRYVQFRTQLRNLVLCYIHAITQSNYTLAFYDNGAIKSVAPSNVQKMHNAQRME